MCGLWVIIAPSVLCRKPLMTMYHTRTRLTQLYAEMWRCIHFSGISLSLNISWYFIILYDLLLLYDTICYFIIWSPCGSSSYQELCNTPQWSWTECSTCFTLLLSAGVHSREWLKLTGEKWEFTDTIPCNQVFFLLCFHREMSVSVKPFLWSDVLCRSHTAACGCLCIGDNGSEQHQSWGLVFQKTCTFLEDLSPAGILGGALYICIIRRVSLKISDIGISKYMIVEIKFDFCDIKLTGIKMQPGTKKTSIA